VSVSAEREVKTTCPYCGVGCGVLASVDTLGEVSVRGDPQHPANLGRLCSKGAALGETVGPEDRLLYPEIAGRVSDWDQALDHVAGEFQRVIAQHGPDAVAFYVSGQLLTEDYYAANKLMKGFIGSANIDTNSRLCMSSAVAGHKRAFGSDSVPCSYEDLERAKLIVLTGSNTAWCHPVLFQRIRQAKKDNPDLLVAVVDPRRTATCDIADLHLALKPGSDTDLFNGLLCYLHANDESNPMFVGNCTEGVDAALAAAQAYAGDPAEVAARCGLPEAQLLEFYRLFARTERVVTVFSQGINQFSYGVLRDRAAQRHGRARSRRAGQPAGRAHGYCQSRAPRARTTLLAIPGDRRARRPESRGPVQCHRRWPRQGRVDHGHQPRGEPARQRSGACRAGRV